MAAKRLCVAVFVCAVFVCVNADSPADTQGQAGGILPQDAGFSFEAGITSIYQQNLRGGQSTHRRAGRFSGSYDLELEMDLHRLLGLEGATLFMAAEGSWSKSGGIDGPAIGSFFGVNDDGSPRQAIVISELWFQQSLLDDRLQIRIGKMDLTGGFQCSGCPVSFDCCGYANDETTHFLNSALVNNPTIPFPEEGLGIALHYTPVDDWYISAAVADAQADGRETGFRTAFHDEDYYFYIAETGITPRADSPNGPLQGAYRIGAWFCSQPTAHSDAGDKLYNDNAGLYMTFDQMLVKENDRQGDTQGLGAFFRYGYAPPAKNDMTRFYSFGLSWQGLFDGRDQDTLGAGFARGYFSDRANLTYHDDAESVWETYYSIHFADWITVSPSMQYIANPGGQGQNKDAVVAGIRIQMMF